MAKDKFIKPKHGCLYRLVRASILLVVGLVAVSAAGGYFYIVYPLWGMPFNEQRHGTPPLTPMWAFEPWLWEDDVNTAAEVMRLVEGYEQYDIPVRTVLIDSPWSLRYNDFALDEERYPASFYTDLQDDGYRVVLWMTCMVNNENKDTFHTTGPEAQAFFDDAKAKGYLAAGGADYGWWKGNGGFVDYTNPEAMQWWRGMQETVFDLGIDGWKLDGAATLLRTNFANLPWMYASSAGGLITTRGYMDHYYRDEYAHALTKNPEFVTLVRSYDRWPHPEGFAPIDAAPVAWVGDQDHTWSLEDEGIEEALEDVMKSVDAGYSVIGSDIGGYGGGTIPANLYIRWAQWSTFCGWFSNGGHGNRALWERSDDELEIIRTFTWLRQELVPYIYTHVRAHHEGGEPLMRRAPGQYQYYFGPDFLIAPIYQDSKTRTVEIPEGRWYYFFDDTVVHVGPATVTLDFPMDEFPVFVREGAVVPLDVKRNYTGFGGLSSEGSVTWAVFPGHSNAPTNGSGKLVRENGDILTVAYESNDSGVTVTSESKNATHLVLLPWEAAPSSVDAEHEFDSERKRLIVTLDGNATARVSP